MTDFVHDLNALSITAHDPPPAPLEDYSVPDPYAIP